MKKYRSLAAILLAATFATFAAGCSKKSDAHAHSGHHHRAPHGGVLVELGDHRYNLELVRDATAGTLTAYVLDGHAENFIRVPLPTLTLVATPDGAPNPPLTLQATANPATGETVGDTSQFVGQAEWLKTTATFDAVIPTLTIRGQTFSNVAFSFAAEKPHAH